MKKTPIRQISSEERKRRNLYNKIKYIPVFGYNRKLCWVCNKPTSEEHHLFGVIGKLFFMVFNRIPLCRDCHIKIQAWNYESILKVAMIMIELFPSWLPWAKSQKRKLAFILDQLLPESSNTPKRLFADTEI